MSLLTAAGLTMDEWADALMLNSQEIIATVVRVCTAGRTGKMKHWMFRCNDVSQKVSRSLDVSLPFHHRMAVRMHLLMCRYCSRFRCQLIMLRKMSRHADDDPSTKTTTATLSDETKERIKKALRAVP